MEPTSTRSAPRRSIPCTRPATGATHSRPAARSRAANDRSSVSVKPPVRDAALANGRNDRVEHRETRNAVAQPSRPRFARRRANVDPDADRDPLRQRSPASAPRRERPPASALADIEIVRPLEPDRAVAPASRARGATSSPTRSESTSSAATSRRALEQREPDACAGFGLPRRGPDVLARRSARRRRSAFRPPHPRARARVPRRASTIRSSNTTARGTPSRSASSPALAPS